MWGGDALKKAYHRRLCRDPADTTGACVEIPETSACVVYMCVCVRARACACVRACVYVRVRACACVRACTCCCERALFSVLRVRAIAPSFLNPRAVAAAGAVPRMVPPDGELCRPAGMAVERQA